MDSKFAEAFVRKWQVIKSQAIGPDHHIEKLPEVGEYPYIYVCIGLVAGKGWTSLVVNYPHN